MGGILLLQGEIKLQGIVLWIKVLQADNSCQIQYQQEGQSHSKYSYK